MLCSCTASHYARTLGCQQPADCALVLPFYRNVCSIQCLNLSDYAGCVPEDLSCVCAAQALKLHFAVPTAIMFLRRYYSVKAIQENDRFIVVCACVFLAAKCEEEPRNLNDVCYQIFKFRCAVRAPADSRCPSMRQLVDLHQGTLHVWLLALLRCSPHMRLVRLCVPVWLLCLSPLAGRSGED